MQSCIPLHETIKALGERHHKKKTCWVRIIIFKALCSKLHLWLHFGRKLHTALSKGPARVLISHQLLTELCQHQDWPGSCPWEQRWPLALPKELGLCKELCFSCSSQGAAAAPPPCGFAPSQGSNLPGQGGWGAVASWITREMDFCAGSSQEKIQQPGGADAALC